MTSDGVAGPPDDTLDQEFRAALDAGTRRLSAVTLSAPMQMFTKVAVARIRQRQPAAALTMIDRLSHELVAVNEILTQIYDQGRAAESIAAQREPLGEAWINEVWRDLDAAPAPPEWIRRWLDAWLEALAQSRWDRCDDVMAARPRRFEADGTGVDIVRSHLRAIVAFTRDPENDAAMDSALSGLLQVPDLSAPARVTVLLLRSRFLRRFRHDGAGAVTAATAALAVAVTLDERHRLLARAGLADACIAADDLVQAHDVADDALQISAQGPHLLVAAGRLATRESAFDLMNDMYDAAVLRFGVEVTATHLLNDPPPNLLWRAARWLAPAAPQQALDLLERAINSGIAGRGPHPERRALYERGQLLEAADRGPEAARAYRDAAWRYGETRSRRALKLYQKVVDLAPDDARYRFEYGEVLRSFAAVPGADRDAALAGLQQAKAQFDRGFALQRPDREQAWAFVSAALVEEALGLSSAESALLIERALLLDPEYARGYAFLAQVLRNAGFPAEAAAAAAQGYAISPDDDLVALSHVTMLADLAELADRGDHRATDGVLTEFRMRGGASDDLLLRSAQIRLRGEGPQAALDILDAAPADALNWQLMRSYCYALTGRFDDEKRVLTPIWEQRSRAGIAAQAAWAAYRLGHLDEAVDLLAALHGREHHDETVESLLGQMLLARAGAGDIETGRRLLLAGIARVPKLGTLADFTAVALPILEQHVAGAPHEAQLRALLPEVQAGIRERAATLAARRRDPDDLAVRLAQARTALTGRDRQVALDQYLLLASTGEPPEVRLGLERAAKALLAAGDDALRSDDAVERAREAWTAAVPAAESVPGLAHRIGVRLGLSALELNGPTDPQAVAELTACSEEPLIEAVDLFARDVPTLWSHADGLRSLAGQARRRGESAALAGAADTLPFDRVYQTSRAAAATADAAYIAAMDLVMGADHAALVSSDVFATGIPQLRDRLSRERGVRVPGVRVRLDETIPPHAIHFLVYGLLVDDPELDPAGEPEAADGGADELARSVLDRLEPVLVENLFRWISLDDIELWAGGWDVLVDHEFSDVAEQLLPVDPPARLRLIRVLRMLLREGVPIVDRAAILEGFAGSESGAGATPHSALVEVRRRLYPQTLGPSPDRLWPVPQELQSRLAAGLALDGSTVWEVPRPVATALVTDLRSWRETLAPGPVAITVDDARLRPFLWRLLAAERPRVYVTSQDELP